MKQLRLFTFPKKKQTRLFTLPADYIDDIKLNLRNLSSLEKYAIRKNVWDNYYLISRFKGQSHVFYGISS